LSKPSQKDAELLIDLYRMMAEIEPINKGLWIAVEELNMKTYDEYKKQYPQSSEGHRNLSRFLSFMELVGTLVKYDVINEDLVFDLFPTPWDRIEPVVRGWQKEFGATWKENYVAMVERKREWRKRKK
jgi:hypothetical protein